MRTFCTFGMLCLYFIEKSGLKAGELVLVKVRVDADERQAVLAIANIFRGNIIDVGTDSMIIELTGQQSKLDAFLHLLEGHEILELARTGIAALCRGTENVTYLPS